VPARTSVTPATLATERPVIVPPAVTFSIPTPRDRSVSASSTINRPSARPPSSGVSSAAPSKDMPRWVVMPSSSRFGREPISRAKSSIESTSV